MIRLLLAFLVASTAFADNADLEGDLDSKESKPPASSSTAQPVLAFGVRFDAAFSGGNPTSQGFSLPSVRLTAFGEPSPFLKYRLSAGQTREWSGLVIPQLTPVEAYVRIDAEKLGGPPLSLAAGMFTPSLNPWWTPDLSDVAIPDYGAVHKAMLISRDLGAELTYSAVPGRLEVALGVFNGSGIITTNTNNARLYSFFTRGAIPVEDFVVSFGAGGYTFTQASRGTVNFKSNWTGDVFLSFHWKAMGATLWADMIFGSFEDAYRKAEPFGGSLVGQITVIEGVKAYARYESLRNSPTASGGTLTQLQIGPLIEPADALKIFVLYQTTTVAGAVEESGQIRLRLNI